MRSFAESLGFTVSFESIPGETGGWCDQKARRIVVDADSAANAQLRILVHETRAAHHAGLSSITSRKKDILIASRPGANTWWARTLRTV